MDMNEFYEHYTSAEQKRDFEFLVHLSDCVNAEIIQNRRKTVDALLDEDMPVTKKKAILKENIKTRIDFANQEILLEDSLYKYSDITILAEKLYNDNTFVGNDSEYVINRVVFLENSITFEDCLIAFHNYRLSQEKEDFEWLVGLLCHHIYYSLSMESCCKSFALYAEQSDEELRKLATFVHVFWKSYAESISEKGLRLEEDKKIDFYQKVDIDASYYFAVRDLEQEGKSEECNQIKSMYASELISQCAKSLYLLLSSVTEIKSVDFSKEVKKLRRDIEDICDQIYNGEIDAFRLLAEDKSLNSDKMSLIESENENRLLKYTLKTALDKLNGLETKDVLACRHESLQMVVLPESWELVEEFTRAFSNKLMDSIPDNLEVYYKRIKQEIGNKYDLLPKEALHELASAEYLFDLFVRRKAPKDFDYSGIAILYFQAFETAYDELVVKVYSEWLTKRHMDEVIIDYVNYLGKKNKDERELKAYKNRISSYFPERFRAESFCRKNEGKRYLASFLEIGTFQVFIDVRSCLGAKEGEPGSQLVFFLENECFNKPIDKESIKHFINALKGASAPRNKAAHGLMKLEESEVIKDKIIVYDESDISSILDYKNLLYAFLDFFN